MSAVPDDGDKKEIQIQSSALYKGHMPMNYDKDQNK